MDTSIFLMNDLIKPFCFTASTHDKAHEELHNEMSEFDQVEHCH